MEQDKTFSLTKVYQAPVETVWKAITEREQLREWYFDFPEDFKLEVGSTFDWYGGEPGGKQWLHRGKMVEIVENKKLVHTWEYPGYTGLSTVTWELKALDENTTQLIFTQEFTIPYDTSEEALRKENFIAGWNYIINTGLVEHLDKYQK
ncbi:MAG TPA: SRPBCC domain-containing protein [Chitinophagaceae bacterium]|jgi:uncharacterized protein YndB with AHSA1/START domain|nr:SRPBCC domain-containing protein [Chitinophagaceae bacterium]